MPGSRCVFHPTLSVAVLHDGPDAGHSRRRRRRSHDELAHVIIRKTGLCLRLTGLGQNANRTWVRYARQPFCLQASILPRRERRSVLPEAALLGASGGFTLRVQIAISLIQFIVQCMVIPGDTVAQHLRSDIDVVAENSGFEIVVSEVRELKRNVLIQHQRFQMIARDIVKWLSHFRWNDRLQPH